MGGRRVSFVFAPPPPPAEQGFTHPSVTLQIKIKIKIETGSERMYLMFRVPPGQGIQEPNALFSVKAMRCHRGDEAMR